MVVQEKERSKKGGESRSQETCSTEHRARQSAACGNGARCVGHRNALHLPSQRTASPDQQSSSTTGKPMSIRFHHRGRDDEGADDAKRKPIAIWFYHCGRHTEGADGAKRKPMSFWFYYRGRHAKGTDGARWKPMTIWFHHPTALGRTAFACRLKPVRSTICKQAPPGQTSSSIFAKRS